MIRDEYSDEVGDLWDAFSKALRRHGRDWLMVGRVMPKPGACGLLGGGMDWAGVEAEIQRQMLQMNVNAYMPFGVEYCGSTSAAEAQAEAMSRNRPYAKVVRSALEDAVNEAG